MARQWADPLALIVDHGLRSRSAAEAVSTAALLSRLGIPSRILTLTGVGSGAAIARAARYDALINATRQAGRVELWLGHHRRDQAETLLMRGNACSGPAGLAGMAMVRETRDIRILRPLLDTAPGALRALLAQAGLPWIEDPTNRNPATLRARLRAQLDDPHGDGPAVRALAETAYEHGLARAARDGAIAAELAARAAIFPEGYALLAPGPISPDALGGLIRALTGRAYAPRGSALSHLAAAPRPAVLAGLRLMPAGRLGPGLLAVREAAAMAPEAPATPGSLWDNRFLIETSEAPACATIGAVGADAPRLRAHSHLPYAVLRTLPALRVHAALVEVPHIGYFGGDGSARMAVSFAPANPACGAPFGAGAGRGCQSEKTTPSA